MKYKLIWCAGHCIDGMGWTNIKQIKQTYRQQGIKTFIEFVEGEWVNCLHKVLLEANDDKEAKEKACEYMKRSPEMFETLTLMKGKEDIATEEDIWTEND